MIWVLALLESEPVVAGYILNATEHFAKFVQALHSHVFCRSAWDHCKTPGLLITPLCKQTNKHYETIPPHNILSLTPEFTNQFPKMLINLGLVTNTALCCGQAGIAMNQVFLRLFQLHHDRTAQSLNESGDLWAKSWLQYGSANGWYPQMIQQKTSTLWIANKHQDWWVEVWNKHLKTKSQASPEIATLF